MLQAKITNISRTFQGQFNKFPGHTFWYTSMTQLTKQEKHVYTGLRAHSRALDPNVLCELFLRDFVQKLTNFYLVVQA